MPYWAEPSTLAGVSSRFSGLPISRNAEGDFNGGSAGGFKPAARPVNSP